MTADDLAEKVAEVLGAHVIDLGQTRVLRGEVGPGNYVLACKCGAEYSPHPNQAHELTHLAEAILASPQFARIIAEAEARALRRVADEAEERGDIGKDGGYEAWTWLRIRADRIAETP